MAAMISPRIARDITILATALSYHWTMTPPNPPVAKEERVVKTLLERTLRFRAALDKTLVWAVALVDIASTSSLLGTPSDAVMPPMFIIGASICILGNLLRVWCFATLGKMFDFEYRIRDNHQLITTGPYSYLRHPSYTGLFAMYIGVSMVVFAPGSWLREYGWSHVASTLAGSYWCVEAPVVIVTISMRMKAEDEGLKRRFGEQWDEFARKAPYCILPWIY